MFEWLIKHSGHHIIIEFEDKPDIGIKRFWCKCEDCRREGEEDHFDYFK